MMPTQPDLQPETPETLEVPTVDPPEGDGDTRVSRWIDDPRLRKAANLIAATLAFYWVLERLWPAPAGVVLKGMVIGGL